MEKQEKRIIQLAFKINEKSTLPLEADFKSPFSIAGEIHGKLEWDEMTKKIAYIPINDFNGSINFFITYKKNKKEVTENIQIHIGNTFRPRARIIKIIGQELISNDVIALVELIKNSYDADSENLEIHLDDIFSSNGSIIIKDDGLGMSYEKIINVWLEPATPDKKSNGSKTFSKCYKRRFLGEKGIGRFAVHRLGEKIELISRSKENCDGILESYETRVTIDWQDFTEDKYLSDIPVVVEKIIKPITFTKNSGTIIKITSIKPWKDLRSVREALTKIKGLESPIKPKKGILHESIDSVDPGIKISFTSNNENISREIKGIKSLNEILETAFYRFSGIVDIDGTLVYNYNFDRVDYQDIKRDETLKSVDLVGFNTEWFEEHPLNSNNSSGLFEVNFYAWDLEPSTLKLAGLSDYYKNIIKPNAGVRIYRDNFRVWPYGEPQDDWLGLDLKRLNEPKERLVSRNQVIGIIHISSTLNKDLKDQSNREGLISNEQYDTFFHLVNASLSVFAKERKKDKIKIDKIGKSKSNKDIVTESIDRLRENITQRGHDIFYENDINKIEASYHEKINDVLERYMMAAAIGISYSIPIHEMKLRLTSIKHLVDDLQDHPELQDKFLKQLSEYVQETQDIVKAVTSIMSKQQTKQVMLWTIAENTQILKQSELKKHNILYNITGDKTISVEAVPGLLSTAVLNVVDNAIFWLRAKRLKSRSEKIEFVPRIDISITKNAAGNPVMKISDNGTGFEDPFEYLLEPYYSTKTDGLGLGLFLVKEIMTRLAGRVNGYNENGAVFELIFKKAEHEKN